MTRLFHYVLLAAPVAAQTPDVHHTIRVEGADTRAMWIEAMPGAAERKRELRTAWIGGR
ncbi:MAG TPA: hypothetical protein VI160_02080 [Gemmatimonadales bacterium]